ncbi:alpha/beta hydrolase [Planctobacterium marinum]|uniref:alpha/beta hydrolase n=1 Tax=Planctobacterium marinum TaxID=1631968 RepID=UPI001E392455|nr:alpha/beta hydrolase [Planctobacterium marinum]MCC2605556.1 alpha/beta hydrolase [Planctobacterium marinum]
MCRSTFLLLGLVVTMCSFASSDKKVLSDGEQQFQTFYWPASQPSENTVVLLSGPNDHWNSDAAWWVTVAPLLQKQFNVLAIDRPAIGLGSESPGLGYIAFASQVDTALKEYRVKQFSILAFASSNMTVLKLLADYPKWSPEKVLLVDPDVLTEFSVARYQSDASPFVENQQKYAEFLSEGKYIARVQEKNTVELEHIKQLAPNLSEAQQSWLQQIMEAREQIPNQVNLFQEIAVYGEDLQTASQLTWPEKTAIVIVDTDFEQGYINRSDDAEAIEGLQQWRKDARAHYKALTKAKHRQLLVLESQEHLVMIEQPELFLQLLQ